MATAFFDLDNTLVRGSSLFIVVKYLASHGHLKRRVLAQAAAMHALYRVTAREHGANAAGSRSLELARQFRPSSFEEWTRDALAQAFPGSVYAGSMSLLRAHQSAGDATYIATAAPVEVAAVAAELLGCTGAVGTVAAREGDSYSGQLSSPVLRGEAKAAAVRTLAEERGVDLHAASAYSDSHNDLPLLRLVGMPHVVNPDGRLRRVAQREHWPVHDVSPRHTVAKVAVVSAAAGVAVGIAHSRGRR